MSIREITEDEYDVACAEFSIYWSESGMSYEYDADYESEQADFLNSWFNTEDWVLI